MSKPKKRKVKRVKAETCEEKTRRLCQERQKKMDEHIRPNTEKGPEEW